MLNGKSEHLSQIAHVLEMIGALFANKGTVFMVQDVQQNGGILINLSSYMVIWVKNVNQWILIQRLVRKLQLFPPNLKSVDHLLDFELLSTLKGDFFKDVFMMIEFFLDYLLKSELSDVNLQLELDLGVLLGKTGH